MSPKAERSALKRSQPGSPSRQDDGDFKKPRRSQRIRGNPAAASPSSPARAAVKDTASPPAKRRERTPHSSPAPLEATQVASQFYIPPLAHDDDVATEDDPNVWGYLVPLNPGPDVSSKTLKLNKSPINADQKSQHGTRISGKKKSAAGGFLIGRHQECDLQLDNAVISNRHCLIYKDVADKVTRAVLEDLSSNGTWVNGVIVGRNKRRELTSGDEIEFAGNIQFVFRYPEGMQVSAFRDTYELGRPLGSGHFATVYTAIEKSTGQAFAVKVFKKRRSEEKSVTSGLQQEISVLMSVSHPNILCLKGNYDEDDGVYLVLELAPEGELFNYIINHQKLSEHETRIIFKQLLSGLKYLHDRNIVHRDIKPENILMVDKNLTVKLADFGLAKIIGEESFTTSLCGTPSYVAPEILQLAENRNYNRAVDMWSLGVVLYICLCGFPPFSDELYDAVRRPYGLQQQILMGYYEFPSPYWDSVGDPACDLVEKMLTVDVNKRITVGGAMKHPWITEASFSVNDSCSSITEAVANMGFVRRKIEQERTLLADAPGLRNTALVNPSKAKPTAFQQSNGGPSKAAKEPDPSTKAFVNIGGKGADETLYGDSFYEDEQPTTGRH